MRILLYSDTFLTPSMTFVYYQLKEIEKNNEVFVVCQKIENQEIFPYNVHAINLKKGIIFQINRVLKKFDIYYGARNRMFSIRLNELCNEFKPDIIHVHFGPAFITIYDNINNKDIPILVTFHGYDASAYLRKSSYVRRLQKIFEKDNIYGITVSNEMRNRLIRQGINARNIFVDYLGVNTDFFKPQGSSSRDYFLQVSNFVEKKGHFFTLKAFEKFLSNTNERRYKLILAGEGPLKQRVQEYAKHLGIDDFIVFPGYVDKFQARHLMNNALCFVHHSITAKNGDKEGIPTVIMEAMAMNLPVISTFHSGIPELVRDKLDGYLVNEKDIDEYAEKMQQVLFFENRRMRDRIIKRFDLKKNTKNLEKIYSKIG